MTPSRGQVSLRRDPDLESHAESLAARLVSRRLMGEYADPVLARAAADEAAAMVVTHGVRYEIDVDGVVPHGHVVLLRHDDDLVVVDLRLDDLTIAGDVRALVAEVAVAAGARRLAVPLPSGDLVRTGFVVGGGFQVVTCRLLLDLDHALPDGEDIVLRPMEVAELDEPDHHLLVGHEAGDPDAVVGSVWLSTALPMVLVQDLQVPRRRREQGLGSALLRAVARWAQQRGSHAVGIDLAADDHVARGLVDHVGFHVVEEYCVQLLADPAG